MGIRMATAAVGVALVALAGCTNPDGTRDNRATGALVGAGTGALIGNAIGGDSKGTLIGAAAGGLGGAAIGNQRDRQQQGY